MKAFLIIVLAALAFSCSNQCETGAVCGDYNIVGPSVPSPTPTPVVGSTPDPCLIKAVRVSFKGGVQLPFLALGNTEQLDATPLNDSGAVPDGCNVAREPVWSVQTPLTCQVIGSGYNPFLRGLRVGSCSVSANVANVVSAPFSVEVK